MARWASVRGLEMRAVAGGVALKIGQHTLDERLGAGACGDDEALLVEHALGAGDIGRIGGFLAGGVEAVFVEDIEPAADGVERA